MTNKTSCELQMLEFLAEQARCAYLSDLKYLPQARMLWLLEGLSPSAFPLQEWVNTAEYLIGRPQSHLTAEVAKASLISFYIVAIDRD